MKLAMWSKSDNTELAALRVENRPKNLPEGTITRSRHIDQYIKDRQDSINDLNAELKRLDDLEKKSLKDNDLTTQETLQQKMLYPTDSLSDQFSTIPYSPDLFTNELLNIIKKTDGKIYMSILDILAYLTDVVSSQSANLAEPLFQDELYGKGANISSSIGHLSRYISKTPYGGDPSDLLHTIRYILFELKRIRP
jgi:hypothetical protein